MLAAMVLSFAYLIMLLGDGSSGRRSGASHQVAVLRRKVRHFDLQSGHRWCRPCLGCAGHGGRSFFVIPATLHCDLITRSWTTQG
jgi:hypothetical protein